MSASPRLSDASSGARFLEPVTRLHITLWIKASGAPKSEWIFVRVFSAEINRRKYRWRWVISHYDHGMWVKVWEFTQQNTCRLAAAVHTCGVKANCAG